MRNPITAHFDKVIAADKQLGLTPTEIRHKRARKTGGAVVGLLAGTAATVAALEMGGQSPGCEVAIDRAGIIRTVGALDAKTDQIVGGRLNNGESFDPLENPLNEPADSRIRVQDVDPDMCARMGGIVLPK